MDIQEKINSLGGHFHGMNVVENVIYVAICWPKTWVVSKLTETNYKVMTSPLEEHYGYYFYADMSVGFEKIFDAIEYNMAFNKMAEEKMALLKEYVEQLKDIFEKEEVETLKTLKFNYKVKKKKGSDKKKRSKSTVKTVEAPVQNVEEDFEEPYMEYPVYDENEKDKINEE